MNTKAIVLSSLILATVFGGAALFAGVSPPEAPSAVNVDGASVSVTNAGAIVSGASVSATNVQATTVVDSGGAELNIHDRCAVTMPRSHEKIEEGEGYMVVHYFPAIGDEDFALMACQVATNNALHVEFSVEAGSDALVSVVRGSTWSGAGTAITSHNAHANYPEDGYHIWTHSPTTTSTGEMWISPYEIIGGSGPKAFGGSFGTRHEFVATSAITNFTIRCQNKGGSGNITIFAYYYTD